MRKKLNHEVGSDYKRPAICEPEIAEIAIIVGSLAMIFVFFAALAVLPWFPTEVL